MNDETSIKQTATLQLTAGQWLYSAVVHNWKTTLLGILGALFLSWNDLAAFFDGNKTDWKGFVSAVLIMVFGVLTKDFNVTQTTNKND